MNTTPFLIGHPLFLIVFVLIGALLFANAKESWNTNNPYFIMNILSGFIIFVFSICSALQYAHELNIVMP